MEIKTICRKENYDKYSIMLKKSGFKVVDEANLVFKETDYHPSFFVGKKMENIK